MSPSISGAYGAMGKAQLQESDRIRQVYGYQGFFATVEDDDESKNGHASGMKYNHLLCTNPAYTGVSRKHPGAIVPVDQWKS